MKLFWTRRFWKVKWAFISSRYLIRRDPFHVVPSTFIFDVFSVLEFFCHFSSGSNATDTRYYHWLFMMNNVTRSQENRFKNFIRKTHSNQKTQLQNYNLFKVKDYYQYRYWCLFKQVFIRSLWLWPCVSQWSTGSHHESKAWKWVNLFLIRVELTAAFGPPVTLEYDLK